jgi:hypothetical protein
MNRMSKRNCPNCGAPYDINLNKCPYCGTSYYDLSALDFTTNEPFYLKIKTEMNGMPCYITQLVLPKANMSIEFSSETTDAYDILGSRICTFTRGHSMTTNISFEAVASSAHKNLCTIEIVKDSEV